MCKNNKNDASFLVDDIIVYGYKKDILFITDAERKKNYVFDLISLSKKEYGIISKKLPFVSNLYVIENIFFVLIYKYNISLSKCYEKFKNIIKWLKINDLLWVYKHELTDLELFKCMFLRALTIEPSIIFIDGISEEEFSLTMKILDFLDKDIFLWILAEKNDNFLLNNNSFKKIYLS